MIELSHTKQRIRAKTAWDADTLRGDYADLLILDEFQLMAEDAWERVGQPMLIDNNGDAIFLYTPPSLHSRFRTRARDPRNASKLFLKATEDASGVWAAFHFTSHDNPHVSRDAIDRLAEDMTSYAYQQEILAEDRDEAPGALWTHALIEQTRRTTHPTLTRIVIGVDPPGGATECGIVVAGKGTDGHAYVLDDRSLKATPNEWAVAVISGYYHHKCDRVVGEKNYGGDMVQNTLRMVEGGRDISYHDVTSTRGKTLRAEPVAALNERGMIHHVGVFPALESEMCTWTSDMKGRSPNRMDASVFALTELMLHAVPIVVPISAASESRWRV